MKVKNVSITYGRKFNLGNYESLEMNISFFAAVDDDEDATRVVDFLYHQAKESLHQQAEPILKRANYPATVIHKPAQVNTDDSSNDFISDPDEKFYF